MLCVWEGIYEEDIIIEKKNITLRGNGSDYTIIQGQGQNENVVTISNTNNIEITGFKITNGKSVGMYLNNTHGCIINDNYFGDTLSDSLFVVYSQDAIITNNEFEGCGLRYMIAEFASLIQRGERKSAMLSPRDMLRINRVLLEYNERKFKELAKSM